MLKRKVLNHLGKVGMAVISLSLMTSPASPIDTSEAASQVIGSEGGQKAAKEAIETVLKTSKSKPALSVATGIVCLACVPAAGAASSPALCVACGILIAKTIG